MSIGKYDRNASYYVRRRATILSMLSSLRGAFAPVSANAIHMPHRLDAPHGCIPIRLRPFRSEDDAQWNEVRWRNEDWLAPWESNDPQHAPNLTFNTWVQCMRKDEKAGVAAIFAVEYQMHIVGQISLGAISYGSMRTAVMGYWVDQRYAGRGITPMAAALLADWALRDASGPRLHRLEIAILPQNERSKRVVNKIGAHYEGVRRRYMFIRGQWRDHETYSLLEDDTVLGFVTDLVSRHAQEESSQKT